MPGGRREAVKLEALLFEQGFSADVVALPYLRGVKPQVVAHDVIVSSYGLEFLHKVSQEGVWVAQVDKLVSWQSDGEVVPLCEPEHDVQDGAAGCLVCFEEHDISLGMARHERHQQLLMDL